ncbi:MAG: protein translocase subunit SecD [Sedimentisphaerales bacterium]
MDRNFVRFGLIATIILVIFAAAELYPPSETLKPGIDLAGGTSLIYEIDTTGLESTEIDNLAQRLSPILLKRIDPGNIQNIIMRPQGDTRLEIQVPLASIDAHRKREAYDKALKAIAEDNINLAIIKRTLAKEPNERALVFAQLAADSNERKEILNNLASAYDARKAAQHKRDAFKAELDTMAEKLEKAGANKELLVMIAPAWNTMDPNEQEFTLERLFSDANDSNIKKVNIEQSKRQQFEQYLQIHQKWSQVVNELTKPEMGLNAVYRQAEIKLRDFNLNIEALTKVLEMPAKSIKRTEMIQQFKDSFPSKAEQIDNLVKVFEEYRPSRGRIDGPEDVKRMLKGTGVLEFRILPKFNDSRTNKEEMLAYQEALKTKGPKLASDSEYIWVQIENIEDNTWRTSERNQIVLGMFADKYYVLTSNQKGECLLKNTGKKPWKLEKAGTTADEMGKRAISFMFDEVGASLFYDVTSNNLQRPLCIILDDMAISAPNIHSAIRANGIIQGDYTQTEQMDMVNKLNAGSLPARLIEPPISEKTIGASIGADNRDQGIRAGYISFVAVAAFMLTYYTLAGSLADVALFMNILFMLAIMALSRATFTLAGIGGIVLTIGMSVDANVLIFERIREEQEKGASLSIAIANGYKRAFLTIFDSNFTTIIIAVILYMVASEEIKGFAITLILGLIANMFTAVLVTRLVFQYLLDKKILKNKLFMLHIIRTPNINWMALRPYFLTFSLILVLGSWYIFYTRDDSKNSKYDIEFTGGTSAQINLKQGSELDRAAVVSLIQKEGQRLNNPAIAAATVYRVGPAGENRQYEITTTEINKTIAEVTFKEANQTIENVSSAIKTAQIGSYAKITNLQVNQDKQNPANFTIITTQLNRTAVAGILEKAFGEKATIQAPVVEEVVSNAIKQAFGDKLEIEQNLEPKIVSTEKISDPVIEQYPELADFLGGAKITFSLAAPTTIAEMEQRINNLRFKPDMQNLTWYKYKLFGPNLAATKDKISTFIYVSLEPEAGYRELSEEEWNNLITNEQQKITTAASLETSLQRVTQIAPSVGKEAKTRALIAIVLSFLAIILYVWFRFGTASYGIAGVVALVHDVSIAIGCVVASVYIADTAIGQKLLISDFKINLTTIAAFLTIIGYSINDTIVIYDRIRENRGKSIQVTPQIINDSINQVLSRSLLTVFTVFLAVLIMYIWGGPGIRSFNFAMLIGCFVGAYSSIAIAAPILILGKKSKQQNKANNI